MSRSLDKNPDVTLKVTFVHMSRGEHQLGLGLGGMASLRLPGSQFFSGGLVESSESKVLKIYTGVRPGAIFRRRAEADAALAAADWRLAKVACDEKFFFSIGLDDGAGGYVGGERALKKEGSPISHRI